MSNQIIRVETGQLTRPASLVPPPAIVTNAGPNARYAWDEFFGDQIDSDHTLKAYRHAVERFLAWCEDQGFELARIPPGNIGKYIHHLQTTDGESASKATKKLHLAGIRRLFDVMVQRHAVVLNPAASVRGPQLKITKGKTPATDPANARKLLQSIDTSHIVGLRDRAVLAIMMYTACRVGAVAKLRRKHFYTDGTQHYLHLDEKGGKDRHIPCRHDLQAFIEQYLQGAGTPPGDDAPLFRSAERRTRRLTHLPIQAKDIHRMVKRRLKDAGLPPRLTCHSFRATTATDLLEQGVPIEDVQELLGHADLRTTRLYDRRDRKVTRNIVERISI